MVVYPVIPNYKPLNEKKPADTEKQQAEVIFGFKIRDI
jgi:hypothetical protein